MWGTKVPFNLGAAILCAGVTLSAQNARVHPDDTNRDGVVTEREWRGTMDEFRRLDRNGDGVISGTELPGNSGRPAADRTIQNDRNSGADRVDRLDRNRNGVVEGYEWPYNKQVFHDLDKNEDSVLDSEELRNISASALRQLDKNGDGKLDANEWPGGFADFDQLDANRDRKISSDEYYQRGGEWQRKRRFDNWDTNHNGMIDADEWRSAPQLFRRLDTNGDRKVTWDEFRADTETYQPPYTWR
jgi:Ca2+-binding EF-hand superfamily protein